MERVILAPPVEKREEVDMYGTIMRARAKPERKSDFEQYLRESSPAADTGFVGVQIGWEDKDPDRVVAVAVFKDRESYVSNAERSETNENYERMLEFLDGGVEWLDVNWTEYVAGR